MSDAVSLAIRGLCRAPIGQACARRVASLLLVAPVAVLGALPRPAAAQWTPPPWKVGIEPTGYAYAANHLNNVKVIWCDKNYPLQDQMRNIFYNGQSVTFQFTYQNLGYGVHSCATLYSGTPVYGAIATGSVTLTGNGAIDSLRAEHWNVNGDKLTGSRQWKKVDSVVVDDGMTNNDNQSAGLCDAGCFAATYTFSTVPYFTLDQPRNITLVYHGDRVALKPFVHVDVAKQSGYQTVSEFWLEAQKQSGASIQFLNGETRLRFAGNSSQQVRLGAQFDAVANGLTPTGVEPMYLKVTTVMTDGHQDAKTYLRTVMSLDERSSRVARGWSVAGLQRLYVSGSDVVIAEGDGSATFFKGCGTGCYTSPTGDFSKLASSGGVYTRTYPDSIKATFNSSGQLTSMADPFGNGTTFVYDGNGRLWKIEDPFRTYNGGANRSYIELVYGAYGLAQIREPGPDGSPNAGRITYVTVQADSTLTAIQDPDGISTQFGYDSQRRLQTVTDRRGGVTTYEYDLASGKVKWVDLPTVTLHDGSSARPRVSYAAWQSMSVPTGPTSGTPFTPVVTTNVLGTVTDPLGRQRTFTANRWGQALNINEPLGRTTTITRTGILPSNITRPTGAIDYLFYSGALPIALYPAGQSNVAIRYGGWALADSVWGGTGRLAERRFISAGKVDSIRIGGLDSLKVRFTYDSRGRVLTTQDPQGHVTSYHYDPVFGNLDSTLAPGSRFTKVTFDGYGRVQTQTSNNEPTRQVVYDALNRVREVYDGVNPSPTRYTYDALYLTRVQDPKDQVFRFDVNALGWVTRKYDPADTVTRFDSFGYDSAGNVRKWINRRGQQIDYTYDALNRLVAKSGTNTTTDSFWYSSDGLKMAAGNAVSSDTVYLRADGWADSVVTIVAGRKFKRIYRPTPTQQLDSLTVVNSAGITFAPRHYGWNTQTGALDTVSVNGQVTRFSRDRDLLPMQTLWPALSRTHQWTSIHRPGELSFSDPTVNTALFRRFSYDSRFNLRDRIQWDGANFRTRQAGYDGLRRLGNQGNNLYTTGQCSWDVTSGYLCPLAFQQTVTYDAGGNRTDVPNAAYATGNRVLSFGVYSSITYDLDGNLTEKYNSSTGETKKFEWSAEGLLTRVLVNNVERVRYNYNAAGLLVRRWTNGTLDRHFLWDQGHILAELDGTATQRIGEYAYLPGADQPVALITGAQAIAAVRYLVQDEVGNVIGLLNGTAIDQQVAYDDWGVPTVTGSADNRLFFKGLLWESNYTGMYYVRARWYDPELQRFVAEDPCGLVDGTNLYAFAGSDAINGIDPSGCLSLKGLFKGIGKAFKKFAPAILGFGATVLAAAAGPMPFGAAVTGAIEAFSAAAFGSAVAAAVETAVTRGSFKTIFRRNFNTAGVTLGAFAAGGALFGGGVKALGSTGLVQGSVETLKPTFGICCGFTLGSASIIADEAVYGFTAVHELRHTIQFIALSALGSGRGHVLSYQWYPYLALGGLGILARDPRAAGDLITLGRWWEGIP